MAAPICDTSPNELPLQLWQLSTWVIDTPLLSLCRIKIGIKIRDLG